MSHFASFCGFAEVRPHYPLPCILASGKGASASDRGTVLLQNPWYGKKAYRDETKQRRCPTDTESFIHLHREEWKCTTGKVSQETICGGRTSASQRTIRIHQVNQDGIEHQAVTGGERNRGQNR